MTGSRHTIIPEVHLVLFRNNEVFMMRRYNTGYEDGKYALIAGHVERRETFKEAIIREAGEEAGIRIKYKDISVAHIMYRKNHDGERVAAFVVANNWQGEPRNMEPHKCDDMKWFKNDFLPKNIVPYVAAAIENTKKNINYSEYVYDF